jgi:ADP-ribosyl-[dinitrogen reductase] hydrolase
MSKFATLVGCAIGDALGNPFETKLSSYQPLREWDGKFKEGGTFWWGQPGQYTDDTLMSLGLARSLVRCKGFNPADVAREYLAWYESKNTRGIGGTTARAMVNLQHGLSWDKSGVVGDNIGGNGTAMRATPLGLAYRNDFLTCMKHASEDAIITHNSSEPINGSIAIALGTAQISIWY